MGRLKDRTRRTTALRAVEADAAFQQWQAREAAKDLGEQRAFNRTVIENGDPDTEAAIAALEQGWENDAAD